MSDAKERLVEAGARLFAHTVGRMCVTFTRHGSCADCNLRAEQNSAGVLDLWLSPEHRDDLRALLRETEGEHATDRKWPEPSLDEWWERDVDGVTETVLFLTVWTPLVSVDVNNDMLVRREVTK